MFDWINGLGAFCMFFIYDWNRVFGKKEWLTPLFAVGNLCLTAVGVRFVLEALKRQSAGSAGGLVAAQTGSPAIPPVLWLIPAACFLAALLYTLFFALPFDSTYRQEADGRKVCRTGIYGWCRHPGIWWFLGCFLCLSEAAGGGERVVLSLVLSGLNLLYAWYQDQYIFVREFSDYEDYRRTVPFLIPTIKKGR